MKTRLDPHSKYRELLAARLDRPLTRAENRQVVAHLKTCVECRQVERDYIDQRSMLRAMARPVPPRDLWARTSTSLDREVARWSYRYPRFGRRRVPLGDKRSHSGAPSALATAVAALGVVSVLVVLQLAPTLRPQAGGTFVFNPTAVPEVAVLRPTPFAVAPQPLAVWAAGVSDFAVYETQVTQVCPPSAFDCFDDEKITRRSVALSSNIRPQNVALSPGGDQLAVVGSNLDRDFIGVVMLQSRSQPVNEPQTPPRSPEKTPDVQETAPPPTATAATPQTPASDRPVDTSRPTDTPSGDPGPSTPVATTVAESAPPDPTPDASPTSDASPTPDPEITPEATTASPTLAPAVTPTPPSSAVPGLTVLSILEDVHSAGAPPAWSRDGALLAFSAMPADGRHGPDVYVWAPGDDQAHPITSDHASFFASWSGKRIVVSRIDDDGGKSDSLETKTVVIDPMTLEERVVDGPQMWLPVVDSQRAHAIVWHGKLDRAGELPVVSSGALYLVDWAALNPFRDVATPSDPADSASTTPVEAVPDANAESAGAKLTPIDPSRDPNANPVFDWFVRWSADGRVLGIWVADSGASWGELEVLTFDRETDLLDRENPLVPRQLAKRGFSLGVDRVAWVGAPEPGSGGDLHIQTWGDDGIGELRIKSLNVEELVPAF